MLLRAPSSEFKAPASSAIECRTARRARLLPLSAKTDEALAELADRYLTWLDERSDFLDPSACTASAPPCHCHGIRFQQPLRFQVLRLLRHLIPMRLRTPRPHRCLRI